MSKYSWIIAVTLGSVLTCNAEAWVATRGHGGVYHTSGYHNAYYGDYYHHGGYYYNDGWSAHGVIIGVPAGVYNGYGCGYVQTCTHNGCVNQRVCR